jgi:hypothetical protein
MFALADRLKMTVEDLSDRMSVREFIYWSAFHKVRNER